jgi:hypothetical protein
MSTALSSDQVRTLAIQSFDCNWHLYAPGAAHNGPGQLATLAMQIRPSLSVLDPKSGIRQYVHSRQGHSYQPHGHLVAVASPSAACWFSRPFTVVTTAQTTASHDSMIQNHDRLRVHDMEDLAVGVTNSSWFAEVNVDHIHSQHVRTVGHPKTMLAFNGEADLELMVSWLPTFRKGLLMGTRYASSRRERTLYMPLGILSGAC